MYLDGILRNFNFGNEYQADRVLKKHYETTFGIFDHRSEKVRMGRPWAGSAALPGNTPGPHYVYRYMIREYYDCGIKDILDMPFSEFIQLPSYEMAQVKEQCREIRKEENERKLRDAAEMKNLMNSTAPGKGSTNHSVVPPHR